MLLRVIGARCFTDGQTVVDVSPVIRRNVYRIDAPRLDRVDELEYTLDLRPAIGTASTVMASPVLHTRCPGSAATCFISGTPRGRYPPSERKVASGSGARTATRSVTSTRPGSPIAYRPIGVLAEAFQTSFGANDAIDVMPSSDTAAVVAKA